jgi:signal transduction histidine kinase
MEDKKITILHIEDNVSNRLLVRRILEKEGYNILEATNGMEGYEMALKRPDLILMDINIPGIDGKELSTKIKSTESLKEIPIIAVTANVMKGDREKILVSGCDGYIPKPIDIERFPEQLRSYLTGKKEKVNPSEEKDLLKDYSRSLVSRLEEKVVKLEKANEQLKEYNEELERKNQLIKEAQDQLIQSEKMGSIGRFTASIVHEINNPLSNIMNYSELAIQKIEKGQPPTKDCSDMMKIIYDQSKKISNLVKELLAFSRKEDGKFEASTFNKIVDKVMQFMKKDINFPNVRFDLDLKPDLHEIMCIESRIEQVVVNLINNARYALVKKYGDNAHEDKKIVITTRDVEKNDKNYSQLSIRDFGTGIPKDIVSRIFEPFFTTKPKKEGTGLGLSICYQIVENHKGKIEINSEEDKYTEFVILIPRSE